MLDLLLTMVFNSVGLPVEAIGIIMVLTVFWIWQRTTDNITVMLFVRPLWLARMGLWIRSVVKLNKNIGVYVSLDSGMHVFLCGERTLLGGQCVADNVKSRDFYSVVDCRFINKLAPAGQTVFMEPAS